MHNLSDGFIIGAAFSLCDNSMGWTVAMGAFAHELAQELADYFLLTGPGGLKWWQAILVNVLSGLGVVLGGMIMVASDVSYTAIGLILVFGAGTYLYLACAEAATRMFSPEMSIGTKITNLILFVLGALFIGLVLFNHEHCEGEDGHGHGH